MAQESATDRDFPVGTTIPVEKERGNGLIPEDTEQVVIQPDEQGDGYHDVEYQAADGETLITLNRGAHRVEGAYNPDEGTYTVVV